MAGPGFVNLQTRRTRYWQHELAAILDAGPDFGRSTIGGGRKVNVEYVSANPTGPMHVGHCRGAVVGDALANLLAFAGYDVTKEYYINDAGAQIDVLGRSVMLRYREALGDDDRRDPAGPLSRRLSRAGRAGAGRRIRRSLLQMPEDEALAIVKDRTIDAMMAMIREDLALLNVHHEVFFSERSLHADNGKAIRAAITDLTLKGHIYKGKLPPPKGEKPDDWEDREQTLFRSTEVGDDIDRPLVKSDGSFTYFAADVAYLEGQGRARFPGPDLRAGRRPWRLRQAHGGAGQGGIGRLDQPDGAAVPAGQALPQRRAGAMSKRSGDFVTLREVVEEVGRDPIRFMMLYRKNDAPLDFDFAKVTEQSKDNPVFYVQYASARCHSVFRQAAEQLGDAEFRSRRADGGRRDADRRGRDRADQEARRISAPDRRRRAVA